MRQSRASQHTLVNIASGTVQDVQYRLAVSRALQLRCVRFVQVDGFDFLQTALDERGSCIPTRLHFEKDFAPDDASGKYVRGSESNCEHDSREM